MTQLQTESNRYLNRELSWLAFNRHVLEEAQDPRHPLLERIKYMAIFSSNLDEFFMNRVAGLKEQIMAGETQPAPDGRTPQEQLKLIRAAVQEQLREQRALFEQQLLPELRARGIELLRYHELSQAERQAASDYFDRAIFPILTPLAIDPSHPFPHISNLSLNLAVLIRDEDGEEQIARVKVPETLPRLLPLARLAPAHSSQEARETASQRYVWVEEVIAANLASLFPGITILEAHPFRITRNADVEIDEDESDDLLHTIEQGVRQRRFGTTVRFTTCPNLPGQLLRLFKQRLQVGDEDTYIVEGPLGLASLRELLAIERYDLKHPPFVPAHLGGRISEDLFAAIRDHDILLHHPYDSFEPVVDFIRQAARDPAVLAIKQTLYRVGRNSPIIEALMAARERGKQVAALVELKARFDEEHNISWARALERTGVHVAYGMLGLKTHCKITLVVRREHDGLRRYVHLGTGNYNAQTALSYTDLGLFTCQPEIGADVSELFNYLTGYAHQRNYRQLLVAPVNLRDRLSALIEREIAQQRAHGNGRLIFQLNALVEPAMIELLYQASQAGVKIDLVVRSICCLRPGVPSLSESISVRSIVGRFHEHRRIFYFHNGGDEQIYLASGDLTTSNLSQRVEVLFPVRDPHQRAYLYRHVLLPMLRDTERARVLNPDGSYGRVRPRRGQRRSDSQQQLLLHHAGR